MPDPTPPTWEHGMAWHQAPGRRVILSNPDQRSPARTATMVSRLSYSTGSRPDLHPWNDRDTGTVVTVDDARRPYRTTILLDRTGTIVTSTSPGLVYRLWDDAEAARTRANLAAAGYRYGRQRDIDPTAYCASDGHGWWLPGSGSGYSVGDPTPDDPEPLWTSVCDAYGHDWPQCEECGRPRSAMFMGATRHTRWCFTCQFWLSKVGAPGFIRCAVEDNQVRSYHVRRLGTHHRGDGLGFAGAVLRFRMLADDRVIESNDVFTQGIVPDRFRDRLPVNAERLHGNWP